MLDPSEDLSKNKPKGRTKHRKGSSMKNLKYGSKSSQEKHIGYIHMHIYQNNQASTQNTVNCTKNFDNHIHIHI